MALGSETEVCNRPQATFSLYSALPPELRREIWLKHLEESTPMVYRLGIRHNGQGVPVIKDGEYSSIARAKDRLVLVPGSWGTSLWSEFVEATAASRAALGCCSESREVTISVLPDLLPFHKVGPAGPPRPSHLATLEYAPTVDLTGSTEYILRFNGRRDVIVMDSSWHDQEIVLQISRLQPQPDAERLFSGIQHLGLRVSSFLWGAEDPLSPQSYYGVTAGACDCSTDRCGDACRLEPLPRFLALFPRLRSMSITHSSPPRDILLGKGEDPTQACGGPKYPGGGEGTSDWLGDCVCVCDVEKGAAGPKHVWPTMMAADLGSSKRYLSWDERAGCGALEKFSGYYSVDRIRDEWRKKFPYYRELEHLDIRFLRRIEEGEPEGVNWSLWVGPLY